MVPAICTKNEGLRHLGDRVRVVLSEPATAVLCAIAGGVVPSVTWECNRLYPRRRQRLRVGSPRPSMRMLVQPPRDAPDHEGAVNGGVVDLSPILPVRPLGKLQKPDALEFGLEMHATAGSLPRPIKPVARERFSQLRAAQRAQRASRSSNACV